jgi:hypothetical protein
MRHRTTFVLLILFLTGLGVLWWADYADVPTRDQKIRMLNRLLPELIDTNVTDIRRIEVDRGSGADRTTIVVERRDGGLWQMMKPVEAAADTTLVETLAGNLKDLRKSADAGTIRGNSETYGLATPEAIVKVFGADVSKPLATLDLGKSVEERVYVRPGPEAGFEVVDKRLLAALLEPAAKWRDEQVFRVPSFRVESLSISETKLARPITLKRDERRWHLVSPIKVPADDDKAEGLVAELAALRVADGIDGFVEDNVRDRAKYGLSEPSMTLTVSPFGTGAKPQVLYLGKPVPEKPDQIYAMRGDQDDVVRLDVKRLRESMPGVNGLRSQTVLDFTPQRIYSIRIDGLGKVCELILEPGGWQLVSPVKEHADSAAVQSLLMRLASLKASEFLDPASVPEPRLDPPAIRVRAWQTEPATSTSIAASATASKELTDEPRIDLSLGRHDGLKKTVFGRIQGDESLLALPDALLKELPMTGFAFRDRTILTLSPAQFARLTVEQHGSSATVEAPSETSAPGQWKMVAPVSAPADNAAVTSMLVTLSNLRAESWESDTLGDGKVFGLDAPWLRVKWSLKPGPNTPKDSAEGGNKGSLRIGKAKTGAGSYYANIEGESRVFSLSAAVVKPFEGELHASTVLSFKPDDAVGLTVQWPTRTLALNRSLRPGGMGTQWQAVPGYDPSGFDASRAAALIAALAELKTPRFLQYDGKLPESAGLDQPRMAVKVRLAESRAKASDAAGLTVKTFRIGNSLGEDTFTATTAEGDLGPVFVLSANASWKDLIRCPARPDDLPENVFTPEVAPSQTQTTAPQPARP